MPMLLKGGYAIHKALQLARILDLIYLLLAVVLAVVLVLAEQQLPLAGVVAVADIY
jgi:hypothetical protein